MEEEPGTCPERMGSPQQTAELLGSRIFLLPSLKSHLQERSAETQAKGAISNLTREVRQLCRCDNSVAGGRLRMCDGKNLKIKDFPRPADGGTRASDNEAGKSG